MATSGTNQSENYLCALFEFGCRARGSDNTFGSTTVVAGDTRAIMPHYDSNYLQVPDGSLVVVSGTPRYSGYCAHIGRTWPAGESAKFSRAQRDIYSIVEFVQNGLIASLKAKPNSLDDLYLFMIISFSQKLFELGFFVKTSQNEIFRQMRELSPQFVGHHIGLDFHDTLDIPTSQKLRPGMVITILPGLYIPEDNRYPAEYHNIGVRLEDTIVITKDGAEVLTDLAPRDIAQIEQLLHLN